VAEILKSSSIPTTAIDRILTWERMTDIKQFIKANNWEAIFRHCNRLVDDPSERNIQELARFLDVPYPSPYDKEVVIPYVTRLLISLGRPGFSALDSIVKTKDSPYVHRVKILGVVYMASKGLLVDIQLLDNSVDYVLKPKITEEISRMARDMFLDFVTDSLSDLDSFYLGFFIFMHTAETSFRREIDTSVFEIISKSVIKINERMLKEFESLTNANEGEEAYQRFLQSNPCLIDPLAFDVLNKARMGVEHTTDFVLRRLDNEYILVEIEKPSSRIFTKNNDFSAVFTHAMGQVLDFQEWIEGNIAYAQKRFPRISSPQGLLIIGMRRSLSPIQAGKLRRFNTNTRGRLKVMTFDELLGQGKQYQENLYSK
jgi:hypothetical protein